MLTFDCAVGTSIDQVVLTIRSSGPTPTSYYIVTLDGAYVTSVSTSGSSDDRPMESVSFTYEKITWSYTPNSPGGGSSDPITHSYNRKTLVGN